MSAESSSRAGSATRPSMPRNTPLATMSATVRARLAAVVGWLAARSDALAAAMIFGGAALRLGLAAVGWPAPDSDEGTMGLMALHIAYHGEHPIYFYDQEYMGALEAYLAAGFFRLFGPSLFALRLSDILLSGGFLVCFYLLARRLVPRGLALFSLALVAVGSQEALFRQIFTGGGYAETLLFGAFTLLVAVELARPVAEARLRSWRRTAAYAAWGLALGLGFWCDVLVLPFAVLSFGILALFRWRELRSRAGVALALGLLVGVAPVLLYAFHTSGHNPIITATAPHQSVIAQQGSLLTLFAGQLVGSLVVSLPMMTGGAALFPLGQGQMWPLVTAAAPSARVVFASVVHGLWALGYLALLIVALRASGRVLWSARGALWRMRTAGGKADAGDDVQREALARECARLALLVGAGVTVVLFTGSPVAANQPAIVPRYLIGLTLAVPVVLAPLWRVASAPLAVAPSSAASSRPAAWVRARRIGARAALALVALTFALGLREVASQIPRARAQMAQQTAIVADLERIGARDIYTEYWTCDLSAFLSRERIVCAVLNGQMRPGVNRYKPYWALVAADPRPYYVFPTTTDQAKALAAEDAAAPGKYQHWEMDGYVIYRAVK